MLYDALREKQFRLRLHIWHDNDFDLPHQHRYRFVTKILKGGYRQIIYTASPEVLTSEVTSPDARPYLRRLGKEPPRIEARERSLVQKEFECFHREGDVYLLNPDILHSSRNTNGNISLFIRGPAIRESALELELNTGAVYRRYAKEMETSEHRDDITMSREKFREHLDCLGRAGLIPA
jgi:hypothetical protein